MAQEIQVDTRRPLTVAKEGNEVTIVKNISSATVYYKTGSTASSVSSTSNDGSLAQNASLTLTQTTCFIATTGGAQVEVIAQRLLQAGGVGEVGIPTDNPNLKEFGARGDGKTDDTAAILAAVASFAKGGSTGVNGGVLYVPPGAYVHTSPISLKSFTGARIVGSGGLSGSGALGVGASVASTVFIYEGTGARAWDFRNTIGCGMENLSCLARGETFAGYIWDFEGPGVTETSALNHFVNATAEAGRTLGGAKEIVKASGANLARCNGMRFDNCVFSGNLYGVAGRAAAGVESVAHTFEGCWFVGNQTKHVVNPDCDWVFKGCVGEGLFDTKGAPKKEVGFIGYTESGITSRGMVLDGCWSSSNEAATRTGVNVEYRGDGLVVRGGEYACGETGIFFPEGPVASTVQGTRFTKLTNGMALGGKSFDSILAFNKHTEVTNPISGTKEYKGCIVQEANSEVLKVS